MIKLINVLTGDTRTATTPIGLENLKASWRFSTDFPVAVDRGISSENLKFYRLDRDWLLAVFNEYGTNAVVDLEFSDDLLSFSVAIDFTTATWDDVFFEVGYKFSRLADKIKELDEVGKVEVGTYERAEYQLHTTMQSVAEQTETKSFDGKDFGIEKTTVVGQKHLTSVLGPINAVGLPNIPGVELGSRLGYMLQNDGDRPTLVAPVTVGSTLCDVYYSEDFCSILSWIPADAADAYSTAHIEGRWNLNWALDNNASSVTSTLYFLTLARYYKRGGNPSNVWRVLSQYVRTANSNTIDLNLSFDMPFPSSLSTTYGGVEYEKVTVYLLCIPYITADLAAGLATDKWVGLSDLLVSGVKITSSLTTINRNVFTLPVNGYFAKLGLFDNRAAALLEPAMLTSQEFMQAGAELKVKPTDVMHDISLLYGVKFVENGGKYTVMRLDEHTDEVANIQQFTDVHYTALPCVTGMKMAERTGSDEAVKYPEQIFTGTAAVEDERIPASLLQLSTSLTTDGGQILQELFAGTGAKAYLFHANDVPSRQLTPPELGRQINEYYMFREAVSRLLPFVGSWLRPLLPLEVSDCDPYYNPTTGTGATDTIQPPSPVYGPAVLSAKIPVTFATVRALLGGCKRMRLGGVTVTLKDIEINTEPSVAEISGFVEL